MSEQVKLDMDSSGFVASAEKAADGVRKIKGQAKGLGDQLTQTFAGMAKGVLIVGAVTKAMEALANASKNARDAAAKFGEERGGEALRVANAMRGKGTQQEIMALTGVIGEGATTAADTTSFIESMAKDKRKRTPAQMQAMAQAFTSGLYSQEELLSQRQAPTMAEIAAREASLPPGAQAELGVRRQLRQQEANIRGVAADRPASRFVEGERQRQSLESPGLSAIRDFVESLPILGPVFGQNTDDVIEAQQRRQRGLGGKGTTIELGSDSMSRLVRPPAPVVVNGSKE